VNSQQIYPTDMTDSQWDVIKELIPPPKPGGRPRTLDMRQVVNAIFYLLVGGIQWRMMPKEYPKWKSVYHYFRQWSRDGTWQGVRGYDAGKHVMGRKRHILVDTQGLLLAVAVTPASMSDPAGARLLLRQLGGFCKNLRKIWVDGTYRGDLIHWVARHFRFRIAPVLRTDGQKGFLVLPRRWVVERTFSWFDLHRRLSKDYEHLTDVSASMTYIAMTRVMLRRLARV